MYRGRRLEYDDEIYGSVVLSPIQMDLYRTQAVRETRHLTQLGLCENHFPAANHTRLIHNVGSSVLASHFARALRLGETETKTLEATLMLHDLGQLPFGHSAAGYFQEKWGYTQEKLTHDKVLDKEGEIRPILLQHGVNPQLIAAAIFDKAFCTENGNRHRYLKQLVAGTLDVDRLDFLMRDSLRTTPFGRAVDYKRLLRCIRRVDHPQHGDCVVYTEDALYAIAVFKEVYKQMYRGMYEVPRVLADEVFLDTALTLAHEHIQSLYPNETDPSRIREEEFLKAVRESPVNDPKCATARMLLDHVYDPTAEDPHVAFLRTDDPHDQELFQRLQKKFPLEGQGQDPLEVALYTAIPQAKPGEIIVHRTRHPKPTPQNTPCDVLISLQASGFQTERIVNLSELMDVRDLSKRNRNCRLMRVLTVRDALRQPIQEELTNIAQKIKK